MRGRPAYNPNNRTVIQTMEGAARAMKDEAIVKIEEIGATAECHVLAVIHVLAVRQHVGRCAAAKEGTLFEQAHAPAGLSQRDAGCQSRQPAADHDHIFQEYSLPCDARNAPWR